MKYYYLSALIILFISCKNNIESHVENHIDKLNMHGKIKSLKEISFIANSQNGIVKKGEQQRDIPISDVYEYMDSHDFLINFDTVGRITDYTFYYYDGEIAKKDTCEYVSQKGIDGDPAFKIHFLYKEKNNKQKEYSEITNATYEYDKKGNLVLIDYEDLKKSTYKYDANNNVIEEKDYDDNGVLSSNIRYQYKYDKKLNWTEKIKYVDKKPEYIFERQIKYY